MIRCLSRMCALYDNPSSPLPTHVQGDKPENSILFLLSGRLSYSPAFSSTVKLAAAPAPGAAGREGGTILANKNSAPIRCMHGYVPEERKGKEEREVPEISLPEKGRRRTNVGQPETGGKGGGEQLSAPYPEANRRFFHSTRKKVPSPKAACFSLLLPLRLLLLTLPRQRRKHLRPPTQWRNNHHLLNLSLSHRLLCLLSPSSRALPRLPHLLHQHLHLPPAGAGPGGAGAGEGEAGAAGAAGGAAGVGERRGSLLIPPPLPRPPPSSPSICPPRTTSSPILRRSCRPFWLRRRPTAMPLRPHRPRPQWHQSPLFS